MMVNKTPWLVAAFANGRSQICTQNGLVPETAVGRHNIAFLSVTTRHFDMLTCLWNCDDNLSVCTALP